MPSSSNQSGRGPHPKAARPFRAETHGVAHMVVDAHGINWGCGNPAHPGAVFFETIGAAKAVADEWNSR